MTELKKRDLTVEKNKKLRAQKKPEEPVPVLDQLESMAKKAEDGTEIIKWFLLRCPQFKHLNVCLNSLEDDCLDEIDRVLRNTTDDFTLTLSGNPFTPERITELQKAVTILHQERVSEIRASDAQSTAAEDADIAIKRLAF